MNEIDNVLNAQEAADFPGAHVETVRRRGEIPAFKMGKDWRFHHRAVLRGTSPPEIVER